MKNCLKCGAENSDKARFCENCGAPFQLRCPACNVTLERESNFCPNCGANLKKAAVAPAPVVPPLKPATPAAPETAVSESAISEPICESNGKSPLKESLKDIFEKVFYYVRLSLTPLLALIMFIMSFFGVTTLDLNDNVSANIDLSGLDLSSSAQKAIEAEISDLEISSLQIIEGAFARIDPKSDEKVLKDFKQYIQDNATKRQEAKLNGSDTEEFAEAYIELLEDYNVLLLMSMETLAENTPSFTLQLFEMAGFALLQIGLTLALFIVSLIRFINDLTNKEKNRRMPFKLLLCTLGSAICFGFLVRLIMQCEIGSGLKTIIILGLIAVLAEIGFAVAAKELTFTRRNVLSVVAAGVGIAFILPLMTFACAPLLTAAFENGGLKYTENFVAGHLVESWDFWKLAESMEKLGESMYGTAEEAIPAILDGSYSEDLSILNPAYMGVLGTREGEVGFAVLGIVLQIVTVVFLIVAAFGFINRINAIRNNKSASLLFPILTLSINIAILVLSIVYANLANDALEKTALDYNASVAAALIVFTVFSVLDLVQAIVFKYLCSSRVAASKGQAPTPNPAPDFISTKAEQANTAAVSLENDLYDN
ncbi:MAG: zinc ribbon domain-containing protein [Clostridia bacterium]|nr:zinc ribbon domain-containing protein [Clostridia bacterium]